MLPGLLLSSALAASALMLSTHSWMAAHGMNALTLAIVLGVVVGNTVYPALEGRCATGVGVSKQQLLRLGIVLYGLRLTVADIGAVGAAGVVTNLLVVATTFALACWLGVRWLGMDRRAAMLIAAGSSICGAAAVMAAAPVLRARAEEVTVAAATVVVFGTLAMFLYPLMLSWGSVAGWLPSGDKAFGIYIGSTIHEVAQVLVAGRSVSEAAADTAVVTKMVRVMLLAPVLLLLSFWVAGHTSRESSTHDDSSWVSSRGISIPWFAFAFIGMVLFNSLQWLPAGLVSAAVQVDNFALAMAMAALGLTTQVSALSKAGLRPLALAGVLFIWLVVGGAVINQGVPRLLTLL